LHPIFISTLIVFKNLSKELNNKNLASNLLFNFKTKNKA
jgi:hypothetical protein